MKAGDLVKYDGVANYYKGSVGVVTEVLQRGNGRLGVHPHPGGNLSPTVIAYMPDLPKGRSTQRGSTPCFHPFCLTELLVIN